MSLCQTMKPLPSWWWSNRQENSGLLLLVVSLIPPRNHNWQPGSDPDTRPWQAPYIHWLNFKIKWSNLYAPTTDFPKGIGSRIPRWYNKDIFTRRDMYHSTTIWKDEVVKDTILLSSNYNVTLYSIKLTHLLKN